MSTSAWSYTSICHCYIWYAKTKLVQKSCTHIYIHTHLHARILQFKNRHRHIFEFHFDLLKDNNCKNWAWNQTKSMKKSGKVQSYHCMIFKLMSMAIDVLIRYCYNLLTNYIFNGTYYMIKCYSYYEDVEYYLSGMLSSKILLDNPKNVKIRYHW